MFIQSWIAYYNLHSLNYSQRETMSNDLYVSFCESCARPISIGDQEKIEMHQKNTKKDHFLIRESKLHAKITTLSQKIAESAESLKELKQRIHRKVEKLIKAITSIRDDLVFNVDREIVCFYFNHQPISNNVESSLVKIQRLKKFSYAQMTCEQMSQLINSAQRVKDKDFKKKQKPKIDKKTDNLMNQFESQLRTMLNTFLASLKQQYEQPESKNLSITHNGPTISNIQAQHQSFFSKNSQFSILEMLKQSQQKSVFSGCNEVPVMKKKWKKANDNSSQISNKQKSKSIISKAVKLKPEDKNQPAKISEQLHKTEKDQSKTNSSLSSFLRSEYFQQQSQAAQINPDLLQDQNQRYESDSQTQASEEDESKLNQTIRQFQREILDNDKTCFAQETHVVFTTIQNLQKYKNADAFFSLKVSIVKVLYYSVLQKYIPKIKFIAGDHTGYGVFFTNYCPGLKVGTQLEMRECKFRCYKGSDQIINNSKFRIMREYQPKIKANLKGHKLNKVITHDLYYPLEDKRCTLVRQIAEILKSGKYQNYFIKRMTVKVVTIINIKVNYTLCLVGDSSGMMLAYLRKDKVKTIQKSDVVRLLNIWGVRGKSKEGQFEEEIMYLDSLQNNCKVLEHRFDFLQVEDKIMTLQ